MTLAPSRRRARLQLGAAFASGVVFAASSPPIDLPIGILVGLGLFAWSLDERVVETVPGRRIGAAIRAGFGRGFLFGLGANLVALRFVPDVLERFTPLPMAANFLALFLLSCAQALPWAAGGAAAMWLGGRIRTLPTSLATAIGVYLATFVPSIFPWTPAGGLANWPWLLQLSEVIGERGTSFLVALSWALIATAAGRVVVAQRAQLSVARAVAPPLALGLAIMVGMGVYGFARMAQVEALRAAAPRAKVALLQPNFDANDRWDPVRAVGMLDQLTKLTKSAEARGAELVVWPESAYPYSLPHSTRLDPIGSRAVLQPGVHGPVLTGAYLKGDGAGYNSAILVTNDGKIAKPYDKRHLLWFGEMVPLADVFPWLARVFTRGTGLQPGSESVVFEIPKAGIRGAVLNCYEDTLPIAGREAMAGTPTPNLLVNVTNDAWFAGSAEGELHLHLSVLRAIEMRRDLVRAVNKGPTTFVDANGLVRARYDQLFPASLPVEPALLETPLTFYARLGDKPLVILLGLALVLVAARARRARS